MAITRYVNSNGVISTCYTEEELQDLIQRKGFQQTK